MFPFMRRFAWLGRDRSPRALALRALDRGHYDDAERRLSELLELGAPPAELALLHNKRGVARTYLQRRDDARADFEAALAALPRFAPALTNVGNLLLEDGEYSAAIAQYERAIRADDTYAVAHFNLGIAYKKLGRFDEGVRELRRAQRLEGRWWFTYSAGRRP